MKSVTKRKIIAFLLAITLTVGAGVPIIRTTAFSQTNEPGFAPGGIMSLGSSSKGTVMSSEEENPLDTQTDAINSGDENALPYMFVAPAEGASPTEYELNLAAAVLGRTVDEVEETFSINDINEKPVYLGVAFQEGGYLLLLREYGYIVEYSPDAPHPFHDISGTLYYLGGLTYGYREGNKIINLTTGEASTTEQLDYAKEYQSKVVEKAPTNQKSPDAFSLGESGNTAQSFASVFLEEEYYTITHGEGVQELNFGINRNSTCGPLAASMLLEYYDQFVDEEFVPAQLETTYHNDDKFHQYLLNTYLPIKAYTGWTSAVEDATLMNAYLGEEERNMLGYHVKAAGNLSEREVRQLLAEDSPIIIGDYLPAYGGRHAMVSYGYRIFVTGGEVTQTHFKVHYGWHDGVVNNQAVDFCEHSSGMSTGKHYEYYMTIVNEAVIWLEDYDAHEHNFTQPHTIWLDGHPYTKCEQCELLQPTEVWDGSIADSYAGGTGTAEDPHQIANGAQLARMAQQVNTGKGRYDHYALTNNILLNEAGQFVNMWTPIGTTSTNQLATTASFDGRGNTVSGVYIESVAGYQGLFGRSWAPIENVSVINSSITVTGNNGYTGGIVGSTTAAITNCYSFNNTISGYSYVGGIAGNAAVIEGCNNSSDVTGANYYVGGIAGSASKIDNCTNTGLINAKRYVGGVAGSVTGLNYIISNCENFADVAGESYIGGVVGQARAVENCINNGALIQGQTQYIGGVVGYTNHIKNCQTGTEKSGLVTGETSVGGVAGYAQDSLEDCINWDFSVAGRAHIGGVAGGISKNASRCYNLGTNNIVIGSANYVGGVVGNGQNAAVSECINFASVSADTYAGGIVGRGSTGSIVSDCTNSGKVSSITQYSGGIIGWGAYIYDCENTANVEGVKNVGGIAGHNWYDIENCYNTGTSVIGGDNAGGIAGSNNENIVGCNNSSNVSGANLVGGIAGRVGYEPVGCIQSGTVYGTGNDVGHIYGKISK